MSHVEVNEDILDWALQRSGADSIESIQLKFPKLREWKSGEKRPTLRQLEDFAKATHTPFGYFFLSKPPKEELNVPDFRTLGDKQPSQPSPDLIETVHMMQRRQDWMREYLIKQGRSKVAVYSSAKQSSDPQHVARNMRQSLGLKDGWASQIANWTEALKLLRDKAESAGILVVSNGVVGNDTHRALNPLEFRGFVLGDAYAPLVFINSADGKTAQMFTLAHELAHVWLGISAVFNLEELQPAQDKTEKLCNKIAAEFLIPENELIELWNSLSEQDKKIDGQDAKYDIIAKKFKVSQIVAARRVLDLSLISKKQFLKFYKERPSKTSKSKSSGGNFYLNQNARLGRNFAEAIYYATKAGDLLYRDAYRLTNLYGNTFDKYFSSLEASK